MGENGSSRNFRMVNEVPRVVTSVPSVELETGAVRKGGVQHRRAGRDVFS